MTNLSQDNSWRVRRWSLRVGGATAAVMLSASAAWACTVAGGSDAATLSGGYTFTGDGNPNTDPSPQSVVVTAWHPLGALLKADTPGYQLYFANATQLASNPNCHDVGRLSDEEEAVRTTDNGDGTGEIPFNKRVDATFTFSVADEGSGEVCFARDPAPDDADVGNPGDFTITVPD